MNANLIKGIVFASLTVGVVATGWWAVRKVKQIRAAQLHKEAVMELYVLPHMCEMSMETMGRLFADPGYLMLIQNYGRNLLTDDQFVEQMNAYIDMFSYE